MSRIPYGAEWDPIERGFRVPKKHPTSDPFVSLDEISPEDWDKVRVSVNPLKQDALQRQVGGNHYKDCKIQPIEYIMANKLEYCPANIIKYATRADKKGGEEDIRKIIHYAELWLENREEESDT